MFRGFRGWFDVLLVNAVPLRLELADDVAALIAAEQLDAVLLRLDPVLTRNTDTPSAPSRTAKNDKASGSGFLPSRNRFFRRAVSGQEPAGRRGRTNSCCWSDSIMALWRAFILCRYCGTAPNSFLYKN